MPDLVICRSDHDYIGYPMAFYWQEKRLRVDQVLVEYRSEALFTYKVRNEEFGIFELDYDLNADEWSVRQL